MNPAVAAVLGAFTVALLNAFLNKRKTKAEITSLQGDAVDKTTSGYHRLYDDQERKIEKQERKIEALEARVTLAEARAIKAEAEAQRSILAEARCLEQCAELHRRVTGLEALSPASAHVVTTVTTVEAPTDPQ